MSRSGLGCAAAAAPALRGLVRACGAGFPMAGADVPRSDDRCQALHDGDRRQAQRGELRDRVRSPTAEMLFFQSKLFLDDAEKGTVKIRFDDEKAKDETAFLSHDVALFRDPGKPPSRATEPPRQICHGARRPRFSSRAERASAQAAQGEARHLRRRRGRPGFRHHRPARQARGDGAQMQSGCEALKLAPAILKLIANGTNKKNCHGPRMRATQLGFLHC